MNIDRDFFVELPKHTLLIWLRKILTFELKASVDAFVAWRIK